MNRSEIQVSLINSNAFFKEFTYSQNKFKTAEMQELELADSFVWLDDFLFIYQVKERDDSSRSSSTGWFKKTLLKTAVKQIKDSLEYLSSFDSIPITNERGHRIDVVKARGLKPHKIIIYDPGESFPEKLRFQKFYESSTGGLIHLFHAEDYFWLCKYLITPYEIDQYLRFRLNLSKNHKDVLDSLPEQYVLGHYLETNNLNEINFAYIENVKNLEVNTTEFDIAFVIENFNNKIIENTDNQDYYLILKELAKLNRSDLKQFKMRYLKAIEESKKDTPEIPYRITSLNSNCGFVFIPLPFKFKDHWKNALLNYTQAHKYDQGLSKCVGMIVTYDTTGKFHDINWTLVEYTWEFDPEAKKLIAEKFPLRKVKGVKDYRYQVKK